MTRSEAQTTKKRRGRRHICRLGCSAVALATLVLAASASATFAATGSERVQYQVASRTDDLNGVPLALLIAFAGALLGALVAYFARQLRTMWKHRRGLLTGFWFWVTYNRDDREMERPVFSIELLEVKHRHSVHGEKIRGTAWRVFADEDFSTWDRRWTLTGWALEDGVECVYKSETGGGNGVVNMWRTKPGYEGEYIPARNASRRGEPHDSIVTEWARLPRELPQKLKEAVELIPEEDAKKYPRRVRRALGLNKPVLKRLGEWLPYAIAPIDNQLVLQAALASRQVEDTEQEARALEIYRSDLHLDRHGNVHPIRPLDPPQLGAGQDIDADSSAA
jgi:hypothetical protein